MVTATVAPQAVRMTDPEVDQGSGGGEQLGAEQPVDREAGPDATRPDETGPDGSGPEGWLPL